MSDNVIPVGNTPIFDQLVRDMAARGVRYEGLLSSNTVGLQPVPKTSFMAPGAWIARPVPRVSPEAYTARVVSAPVRMSPEELADHGIIVEKPVVKETFNPEELIDQAIDPNLHIQQIIKQFTAKYPDIAPVHITRLDNLDCTVTITVEKGEILEQTDEDVNADPRAVSVKTLSEVEPSKITTGFQIMQEKIAESLKDEMIIDPATIDPKYHQTSIGEDVADVLYMKPSAWGSNEE